MDEAEIEKLHQAMEMPMQTEPEKRSFIVSFAAFRTLLNRWEFGNLTSDVPIGADPVEAMKAMGKTIRMQMPDSRDIAILSVIPVSLFE